jgi:hypothetical protein
MTEEKIKDFADLLIPLEADHVQSLPSAIAFLLDT